MSFRFLFFSLFFVINTCQKEIQKDHLANSVEKPHIEGRLPGADWIEVYPATAGAMQAFTHRKFSEAALFLYLKKTEDKAADFMKKLAQSLYNEGYEITLLENQTLKNGTWLNFLAEKPGRVSRIFAQKQKEFLLWAIVKSKNRSQLALISVEVERYLGNLKIVH